MEKRSFSSITVKMIGLRPLEVILFLAFSTAVLWFISLQPWAHEQQYLLKIPLPTSYKVITVPDKYYEDQDKFVTDAFGNTMPIERISYGVYQKMFFDSPEHIVFIGAKKYSLATLQKGAVWLYEDRYWYVDKATFSVEGNILSVSLQIKARKLFSFCTSCLYIGGSWCLALSLGSLLRDIRYLLKTKGSKVNAVV